LDYPKDELIKMYTDLVRGRELILRLQKCVMEGDMGTSFHTQLGQEALDVGILYAMRPTDWYKPTMRSQVAAAMKYDLYEFVAELFCRADGMNKGVCWDYHMNSMEKRMLLSVATLGSDYPVCTGFAWALKKRKTNEVVVTTQGDGACSEGTTYEAWNLAALYKLPIVYVIVNNGWAMSVPLHDQTANPNISEKAIPIGLETTIIQDGNNALAIREAMEKAIEKARQNNPQVVEIKTLRWGQHFFGQKPYTRHDAELLKDKMENDDCVKRMEQHLIERGMMDRAQADGITAGAREEIEDAVKRVREAAWPKAEDIFCDSNVFAQPMEGGRIK
jgi:pyruvate dehydrogenase E1 component alpha subunit